MTTAEHDINALIEELSHAFVRQHRSALRRRRRLTVLGVIVVALMTGVALAGTANDWWTNAPAPADTQAIDQSAKENATVGIQLDPDQRATVAKDGPAELAAVGTKNDGYCLFPHYSGHAKLGSSCVQPPVGASAGDTFSSLATQKTDNPQFWILYGRIVDPKAAAIDFGDLAIGPVELARGGFFLKRLPAERWTALNNQTGQLRILTRDGSTLRQGCIWLGEAPGGPQTGSDLAMSSGSATVCEPPSFYEPKPDLAKAKPQVEITLTSPANPYPAGATLAVYTAPSTDGKVICSFEALIPLPLNAVSQGVGRSCSMPQRWSPEMNGMALSLSASLTDEEYYANLLSGSVQPGSPITKIELRGADRTIAVQLRNGYLLAELPHSPRDGLGSGQVPGSPYYAVGLDANGEVVAKEKLRTG